MKLSQIDLVAPWLRQFSTGDQHLAAELLDAMVLVNQADFSNHLHTLVLHQASKIKGKVGLYAEREIQHLYGVPHRLFREPRRKLNRRATGKATQKVFRTRTVQPEAGSEALIANLITELCRADPGKFLSQPGPDLIRSKRVRAFFIVTDLIGSGNRVKQYLESAWRVASVKSWHSYGLLDFHVIAYAATDLGKEVVQRHKTSPNIAYEVPCPSIDTVFDSMTATSIRRLCIKYDPIDRDPMNALGFNGTGALIAFAHGCPNNAPRLLHCSGRKWKPLFPSRVTATIRSVFKDERDDDTLRSRLERLREKRLTHGDWLSRTTKEGRWMILLLAALRRGPRFDEALARKTGLTVSEVQQLTERAVAWGWLNDSRHLTDRGLSQLAKARSWRQARYALFQENDQYYYPKSLRAPS